MSEFKNPYEERTDQRDIWGEIEVERLKTMDRLLDWVTEEDLTPVLNATQGGGTLLDIGAGTGLTVAALSKERGVKYVALDVNEKLLTARKDTGKVLARSEALPFADDSVDITYSRAATAWSGDPKKAIEEQLRVTRPYGVAVFTEFDWATAKPGEQSSPKEAELMERMRDTMLKILSDFLGFKPNYGSQLGQDVDVTLKDAGILYEREEIVHEFPEGDYSELLLGVVGGLAAQLRVYGLDDIANGLEGDIRQFKELPQTPSFTIPRLVTQRVAVGPRQ